MCESGCVSVSVCPCTKKMYLRVSSGARRTCATTGRGVCMRRLFVRVPMCGRQVLCQGSPVFHQWETHHELHRELEGGRPARAACSL